MFLHNKRGEFLELVRETSEFMDVEPAIVEKDYYVALFLRYLVKEEPMLIFKGGTSLSKCYKLIERFSEDLDVNLENVSELSQSRKKQFKQNVVRVAGKLNLEIINLENVKSGMDYNLYKVAYKTNFTHPSLKQHILVESVFRIAAFPTETLSAACLIHDYLKVNGRYDLIKKYDLNEFVVQVQSLERTFVDKIFAICDYYLSEINEHSRHLYDLHKILPHMKIDKSFMLLFDEVRQARQGKQGCLSAEPNLYIPSILQAIIKDEAYKADYENITSHLLYDNTTYNQTIKSLKQIISELDMQLQKRKRDSKA
ncbi:MAG: nucleotidyl transferase AbiEii/AbiGii toxin family protein [Firmicutes bacterium]|nr:nucleotidyl transferase AbiEii/AbiGii toxin family protein [Bacillota bacterium]